MEIINSIQREILNNFSSVSDSRDFYLTGGTALAYFYLKHRQSNDLDFFANAEEIILPFSYKLEEMLKIKGMDIQRQRGMNSFVELFVKKGNEATIIHLACDAAFHLEPQKEFPEFPGIKVDGLIDIAANKLLALFGRAALRDFIDVYFLANEAKFSPEELMNKASVKDPGFDLYWLGVALERINTFEGNAPDIMLLVKPVDFKEISVFFNQWRRKISGKLL